MYNCSRHFAKMQLYSSTRVNALEKGRGANYMYMDSPCITSFCERSFLKIIMEFMGICGILSDFFCKFNGHNGGLRWPFFAICIVELLNCRWSAKIQFLTFSHRFPNFCLFKAADVNISAPFELWQPITSRRSEAGNSCVNRLPQGHTQVLTETKDGSFLSQSRSSSTATRDVMSYCHLR